MTLQTIQGFFLTFAGNAKRFVIATLVLCVCV